LPRRRPKKTVEKIGISKGRSGDEDFSSIIGCIEISLKSEDYTSRLKTSKYTVLW